MDAGAGPSFGNSAPASVYDRASLVRSLAELGRFAEMAQHEAEAIRIAESTENPLSIASARWAACTHYLLKGDWLEARSLVQHEIAVVQMPGTHGVDPLGRRPHWCAQ